MADAGSITLTAKIDAAGYESGANRITSADNKIKSSARETSSSGEGLKARTVALGAIIANFAQSAVSHIVSFGRSCISTYNSASQGVAQFQNIAQNDDWSSAQVASLNSLTSSLTRMGVVSASTTRAGETALGTMRLSVNQIRTLTPALDDAIVGMHGMNASAGDASGTARVLGKAMSGNVEALRRMGVVMDTATQDQFKKANADQRAAELSQLLEQRYRGVNQAIAATPAGRVQQLRNQFAALQVTIGGALSRSVAALAPLATQTLQAISGRITSMANTLQSQLSRVTSFVTQVFNRLRNNNGIQSLNAAFGALGSAVQSLFNAFGSLLNIFTPIIGAFSGVSSSGNAATNTANALNTVFNILAGAVQGVASVIQGVANVLNFIGQRMQWLSAIVVALGAAFAGVRFASFVTGAIGAFNRIGGVIGIVNRVRTAIMGLNATMMANPIGLVIGLVAALAAGLTFFFTRTNTGRRAWASFMAWCRSAWTNISNFFRNLWNGISRTFSSVWNGITSIGRGAVNGLRGAITGALNGIRSFWTGVWNGISSFFRGVWNGIINAARNAVNGVGNVIRGIRGAVMGAISGAGHWLVDTGRNIIMGLVNGIRNSFNWVRNVISNLGSNIMNWAKSVLHIGSPSRRMRDEVGVFIGQGLAQGIQDSYQYVQDAVTGMANIPLNMTAQIAAPDNISGVYEANLPPTGNVTNGSYTFNISNPDPMGAAQETLALINTNMM